METTRSIFYLQGLARSGTRVDTAPVTSEAKSTRTPIGQYRVGTAQRAIDHSALSLNGVAGVSTVAARIRLRWCRHRSGPQDNTGKRQRFLHRLRPDRRGTGP
eukprot:8980067-Pyramimonas_sp.AAC.1